MSKDNQELRVLLQSVIPEWTGKISHVDSVAGGMTNRNFCVWVKDQPFFVRLSGVTSQSLGIERDVEFAAAHLAGCLGIAPSVEFYSGDHGLLITEYIRGSSLSATQIGSPGFLDRVVQLLRRAHGESPPLRPFSAFGTIEQYWQRVNRLAPDLLEPHRFVLPFIQDVHAVIPEHPQGLCHNDLLAANFLEDSQTRRLWLVDWEYAGVGTVYFDLGNFAANQELTAEGEVLLAQLYFGADDVAKQVSLIRLLRIISDVREALWGMVQQLLSPLMYDFSQYAHVHWERVERAISDSRIQKEFERLQGTSKS